MDIKKALTIIFDIDFSNFDDVYVNSCMGNMLDSLEKAREVKSAYEFLKEKFGWGEEANVSIYKYDDYNGFDRYSVEDADGFANTCKMEGIEKIE